MKYALTLILFVILFACSPADDPKALEFMQEGSTFLDEKNYGSALERFRTALRFELSPENRAKNYRNLAIVFMYQQQMDSAKHYSKLGYECSPSDSYFHLINLAEYQLLSDSISQAIETYEEAKDLKPNEMSVYNNLSLIYAGNYGEKYLNLKKALSNAQQAFDIKPTAVNQEQLASVLFQLESYQKAANLFHDLAQRFPAVQFYSFYEGQSLFFAGEEEKGYELMVEAAKRDAACQKLLEEISS